VIGFLPLTARGSQSQKLIRAVDSIVVVARSRAPKMSQNVSIGEFGHDHQRESPFILSWQIAPGVAARAMAIAKTSSTERIASASAIPIAALASMDNHRLWQRLPQRHRCSVGNLRAAEIHVL
jgi:hypothetical protein